MMILVALLKGSIEQPPILSRMDPQEHIPVRRRSHAARHRRDGSLEQHVRNHLEERARIDRGPPAPRNPRGRTGARSPTACRFQHNWRLWVLGGPCFGVLLLLGGRPTALVAALGIMTCYCFDLSGNTEGALTSVWLVVASCAVTLVWTSVALGVVKILVIVVFMMLVGVWATLQFGFLYRDDLELVQVCERLLIACFPLPAVAILTWAGVALGGAAYATPCLVLALYAAVALYVVPLKSGLRNEGSDRPREILRDSRAAPVLCVCMLVLPALIQAAVDHRLLFWAGQAQRWRSILKVAAAGAVPWPLMSSLRRRKVLWWASARLRRWLHKALFIGGIVSLLVLCETSKTLILLPALRPFLHSAPSSPWDSILASAALYSLLSAFLLWGLEGRWRRFGLIAARALTVATARCMGLLLGVDQEAMILLDVSAIALSGLVFKGRPNFMAYVVGVVGVSALILWFSWQTLWHLNYSFILPPVPALWRGWGPGVEQVPSLSLHGVSMASAALSLGVLLVPGMAVFKVRQVAIGVVFGLHAVLLLLLENVLIAAEVGDPGLLAGLFPLPLAAVTGFLGAWMAVHLVRDMGIDPLYIWVPGSVNVTKVLAWLLVNVAPIEADSAELSYVSTVIPVSALVMAATAPFALFRVRPQRAVPAENMPPSVRGDLHAGDLPEPMIPAEALLCVFFMSNALWVCSGPVISPLLRFLLLRVFSGGGFVRRGMGRADEARPAHVLAFCSAFLGLYVLSLVSRHFPESRTGRRAGTALLAASLAFLVLQRQPSMMDDNDDSGGYWGFSGGVSWRGSLKHACALAVVGAGLLALAGIASPTTTNLKRRAAFVVLVGASLGIWSALVSLPRSDSAILVWAAAGASGTYSSALMVLLETAVPRAGSLAGRTILPEFYAAAVAFMPVAAIAQGLQVLVFGSIGRRLAGIPGRGDINAYGALRFALATAAAGHAIIAGAFKLLGVGFGKVGDGVKRRGMPASSAYSEARWIPVMGNISAILAAAGGFLCCWVHLSGEAARALAAVPSCAVLLLLQEDGRLFRGSGFGVAVPLGSLLVVWALSAAYYILAKGVLEIRSLSTFSILGGGLITQAFGVYRNTLHHLHGVLGAADSRRHGGGAIALRAISFWTADSPWQPLWNLVLLGASLPSHARLLLFLWGGKGSVQRSSRVLSTFLIDILPMVAGDLTSINLLGLVGLVGGATQLVISRKRQTAGWRII